MPDPPEPDREDLGGVRAPPGLCGRCRHLRVTRTQRGPAYVRCAQAAVDDRLAKYPRLPVESCHAFSAAKVSGTRD